MNFLLPKGMAKRASPDVQSQFESQKKAEAKRLARRKQRCRRLRQSSRAGIYSQGEDRRGEKIYGSITNADIASEISRVIGIEIDKRKIELPDANPHARYVRSTVKLHKDIAPKVKVKIVGTEG